MRKKLILCCCMVLMMVSCQKKSNEKNEITSKIEATSLMKNSFSEDFVTIKPDDVKEVGSHEFAKKIKQIRYVGIKSEEPMGEIYQMLAYGNRIFLLDNQSEKIFIYDKNGAYVNKIDSRGNGPKEYVGLGTMCISGKDSTLVVSDRLANKLLFYTIDGDFIQKVNGIPGCFIESFGDKIISQLDYGQSYSDDPGSNFHLISTIQDSVVKKAFPLYPIHKQSVVTKSLQFNSAGQLLCAPLYSDTVYQFVDDSTYVQKYVIQQKKSLWSKKHLDISIEDKFKMLRDENYTVLGRPFLETDAFIAYNIQSAEKGGQFFKSSLYFYEKSTKQSFVFAKEDLKSLPNIIPSPVAIDGNAFVGMLPSMFINNIRDIRTKNKLQIDNVELRYLIDSKTDWEFILVFYELK